MPSLSAGLKLGTGSVSSLLKSAGTLQREIAAYEDDAAKITYANSGHTDEAYQTYVNYLNGRIKTLQGGGSVTDLTKAENMGQEVVTATHANISYQIQQENMRLMATGDNGTVTGYQSKMNVVAQQFGRAMAIGDQTLAFSLQNQYYSLSQSMQAAEATAASARTALETASAKYQGNIIQSLNEGLQTLEAAVKGSSIQQQNKAISDWLNNKNDTGQSFKDALRQMGVSIPDGSQPNYFDIVNGVQGAIYNHTVLESQATAPYDKPTADRLHQDALNLINGTTKISTLGGSMTAQEVQQAAQDPSMFAYNDATGTYDRTSPVGYHYQTGADGKQTLVPTYSGIVGAGNRNKVFFLNPQQTQMMTNLGLNFSMNANQTSGDGVQVQVTNKTPQWLRSILGGSNALTNMYTDPNSGQLIFRAGSTTGTGFSSFILAHDGAGKFGVLEQLPTGGVQNVGGNYGFNAQAALKLHTAPPKAAPAPVQTVQTMKAPQLSPVTAKPTAPKTVQPVQSSGFRQTPQPSGFVATPQKAGFNPAGGGGTVGKQPNGSFAL